jgi:hypothetical protein
MLVMMHAMVQCPDLWHIQNPHAAGTGGRVTEPLFEGIQYIVGGVE